MEISKQIALITGANRGLGRHLAQELLVRGAKVYAAARNPELINLPGVIPIQIDITDEKSIAAAAEIANDVTLLINNAGSNTEGTLLDGSMDKIRLEMDTHFFGTLSMIRAFAPKMEKNGGGTILNILSVLSWLSLDGGGAYQAAKSAEWSMTNTFRLVLAPKNIHVSGLHVAYMDTDMTANIKAPKANPTNIAKIAIDGIEADKYEILADDLSHMVLQNLSGGVKAIYPQLFKQ
ncbi:MULTISPECIES: SDR family oxidoreductase [Bacillaceae]|uniref:Short-chain dehydrogenase n=1 Tax=Gottfriedia luciferensis TaxID=178774 RepID=A0ABX2ZSA0_9BACI|nr:MULTISPECIES: SDR family oxidoreductase [Bacillaceae]ODG92641.1 short-chain dehydrogenase [Gottfriedia luciferensis]SFC37949.1 Short-chain dehydrogenase [Bacillus sp. UNCCL81]